MHDELVEAISQRKVILFAGSGTSAGLGAPVWSGLMNEIGGQLGYDGDVFQSLGASYLTVAEFYKIRKGGIGPLRSWMDNKWAVEDSKLDASEVHDLIYRLDFPIIYTTNYDRNIEGIYRIRNREYHKISNIRNLADVGSGTQIVKFHGDFDDDNSLVLTESDYFNRLAFDTPLDIKLRSDSLGRSLLFVGYSLSDPNVRLLLYKLWRMWEASGYSKDRPKSYLFMTRPDEIQATVLKEWGVETIVSDVDNPGDALCTFLGELVKQLGL